MERYRINTPHVVSEVFADEEAAIINLKTGNYYSLNQTAAEIWSRLEKGANFEEINQFISRSFNLKDSFKTDEIRQFIKKLAEEDLIVAKSAANSAADSGLADAQEVASQSKREYEPPIIECYADMQELLLLDPIHEVEETSWLINKTP